jgi:hypothetical protein
LLVEELEPPPHDAGKAVAMAARATMTHLLRIGGVIAQSDKKGPSMILRPDGNAVIAIGQPAHAWLSGQLADAWSPRPEPYDEVRLAAQQHDLGMAESDAMPRVNPDTGLPVTFLEMPTEVHVDLWTRAPRLALVQSRYAALLVSLHGTLLYEYRDFSDAPEDIKRVVEAYRADQRALQAELIESLGEDPRYAVHVQEEALENNRRLVAAWDAISLMICMRRLPYAVRRPGPIELTAIDEEGTSVHVDPWPFETETLTVRCEGRRLEGRFKDDDALRAALAEAPWKTLEFELVP